MAMLNLDATENTDDAIVEHANEAIQAELAPHNISLDPAVILAILQAVIGVLANCKIPIGNLPAALKNPTLATRLIVTSAVQHKMNALMGPEAFIKNHGFTVVNAVIAAGGKANPADLKTLAAVSIASV